MNELFQTAGEPWAKTKKGRRTSKDKQTPDELRHKLHELGYELFLKREQISCHGMSMNGEWWARKR